MDNEEMDEDFLLSLIRRYGMNRTEARAWKVAILYLRMFARHFPQQKCPQRRGDPRKMYVFRHCYKLVAETPLEASQYRDYIEAQFSVLKNIVHGEGTHALVDPNCLTGPKAWKRWLLWQHKLKVKAKVSSKEEAGVATVNVRAALEESLQFLKRKLGEVSATTVRASLENRAIFRWVALGQVSAYYLVVSPVVQRWLQEKDIDTLDLFALDLKSYSSEITGEMRSLVEKLCLE